MTATGEGLFRIRVLIAEAHGLMRTVLREVLDWEPDIEVVGEAAGGETALRLAGELLPDVVLADMLMPPPAGLDLARRLRSELPSTRTILMGLDWVACLGRQVSSAGAAGFIVKCQAVEDLGVAVHEVSAGRTFLPGEREGGRR